MIEFVKVFILGIIEGITEWLPISSTGHLILANEFLRLKNPVLEEILLVVIQLAAILAVLTVFMRKLNPFQHQFKSVEFKKKIKLWQKILVACIPAGVIGVLADDVIDEYLFKPTVVAVMLIVYGIAFILIERRKFQPRVKSLDDLSFGDALKIGGFQVLSLVPGTSRSGATILGGLISGVDRVVTTEFSFFLALPVMLGASLLKFMKLGFQFTLQEWALIGVASLVAFVVSLLAIRFLVDYVKKHDFKIFGWYRIALGALILAYFLI